MVNQDAIIWYGYK